MNLITTTAKRSKGTIHYYLKYFIFCTSSVLGNCHPHLDFDPRRKHVFNPPCNSRSKCFFRQSRGNAAFSLNCLRYFTEVHVAGLCNYTNRHYIDSSSLRSCSNKEKEIISAVRSRLRIVGVGENMNNSGLDSLKPQSTFVAKPNPVTGKMDWVVQEEHYDYIQEIARSGYGDMLHDEDRNKKYFQAIRKEVQYLKGQGKSVKVLDVGTGTGLLSMMAATAGANEITACEAFQPMAKCAKQVIEENQFSSAIKVVPKRSTDVLLGTDVRKKANLLVTELFDTELIGEGAIGAYTDVHSRLMQEDCLAVPSMGIIYIQPVECGLLRRWNTLQPLQLPNGITINILSSFNVCGGAPSLHDLQVDQLKGQLKFISEPVEVFRFDFSKRSALKYFESNVKEVLVTVDGVVDAFVMWWDLEMDHEAEIILSCAPCWTQAEPVPWRDHWMQALYYPSTPKNVLKGDKLKIHSCHDEYSLWFDTVEPSSSRPVCTCGLHVTFSRSRLGQMNDEKRNSVFIHALQKHVTSSTVCLVVSDGSLLPLIAAALGAKKVFYLDTNRSCVKIIKRILEANNLQDRVIVMDKDAEDLEAEDFDNLKIDLVIAEPYFQAAHLPWENLYSWYCLTSLKKYLSSSAIILPHSMSIHAMAVQFRDLHKIRAPVGNCEGFEITAFDKLIEIIDPLRNDSVRRTNLQQLPDFIWQRQRLCVSQARPQPTGFCFWGAAKDIVSNETHDSLDQLKGSLTPTFRIFRMRHSLKLESSDLADEEIEPQPLWEYPSTALSQQVALFKVDFTQSVESFTSHQQMAQLICIRSGCMNGIAFWTEFDFGDRLRLSNGPDASNNRWDLFTRQGVKLFRKGRDLTPGDKIQVVSTFSSSLGEFSFSTT